MGRYFLNAVRAFIRTLSMAAVARSSRTAVALHQASCSGDVKYDEEAGRCCPAAVHATEAAGATERNFSIIICLTLSGSAKARDGRPMR
jgi:hypothetical protein